MSKLYRQHPITIITGVFKELKSYLIPLFIFLVLRSLGEESGTFFDRWFLIFILVTVGFSLISGFFKWLFFRFKYSPNAIEIFSGVLIKKHRNIKRDRIHTMDLEANVVWQLLDLVSLNIETPGNLDEAEVKISAIPQGLANHIRETLNENGATVENQAAASKTIALDAITLLKAGATSGSVGVVFAVVFALIGQLLVFIPERIFQLIAQFFTQTDVVVIVILFIVGLVISWIISVVRYVLRFAYFTLREYDDYLEIKRGLFVKKQLTIKLSRIQAVTIIEGLIRQPFGYATIELQVAGGGGDKGESVVIHPMIKRSQIESFLDTLLPEYAVPKHFHAVPKRALRRYLFRASIPVIMLLGLGFIDTRLIAVPLVLGLFFIPLGYLRYHDAGYANQHDGMALRFRRVAKTTVMVQRKHLQSYQMITNPFQRLKGLKTLGIWVMASPTPVYFNVKDLQDSDAKNVYDWLKQTTIKTS